MTSSFGLKSSAANVISVSFSVSPNENLIGPTMDVVNGSMSYVTTSEGNKLLTFLAFHKPGQLDFISDDLVEPSWQQDVTIRFVQGLLDDARKTKNGLNTRTIWAYASKKDGKEMRTQVIGGHTSVADESKLGRWNNYDAILYRIQIEHRPWVEQETQTQEFLSVDFQGGISYLNGNMGGGTTDGRIDTLAITPKAGRWNKLWVGLKQDKPIGTTSIRNNIFSQVKVNINTAQSFDESVLGITADDAIDDECVRVKFINPDITSADILDSWSGTKSYADWRPRFAVNIQDWTGFSKTLAEYMSGRFRLVGRMRVPVYDSDIFAGGAEPGGDEGGRGGRGDYWETGRTGEPFWGVRARVTYGEGNREDQEIWRSNEVIVGTGYGGWYYTEFGVIEIGNDAFRQTNTGLPYISLAIDCSLLNIDTDDDITSDSEMYFSALTENWIDFDDFRLIPAESSIYVKLPRPIEVGEQLRIFTNKDGSYDAAVVAIGTTSQAVSGGALVSGVPIIYKASEVIAGNSGFYCPGNGGGHALVILADNGPSRTTAEGTGNATVDMKMWVNPRVYGGEL